MKDQNVLLKKCLNNDIPAVVFQGTDICATEILEAALSIYRKHGCSPEFLTDFQENVVGNFKAYQQENSFEMKLPDLSESEKESFRILQDIKITSLPEDIKDFELRLKNNGFKQSYEETVSSGNYIIINEREYCGIIGKNENYDFSVTYNKETKQMNYSLFSNDSNYPERMSDYLNFKSCFSDIMYKHPLQQKKSSILNPMIEDFRQLGYENLANTIEQYSSNIENIKTGSNSQYTIENINLHSAGSKEITGNLIISQKASCFTAELTNLRITDKSTGKTEPLNVADIDLSKQNPETVKNLLSGKQVEITNKSGAVQMMGLSKTATGWGITAAKQIFSTADSSAGI